MNDKINSIKWLQKKIEFFRGLGFFESYNKKTNEELTEHIFSLSKKNDYWGTLKEDDTFVDWHILSYDTNRVWLINDFMVLGGEKGFKRNFYKTVLEKLSAISLSKFKPSEIKTSTCGYCDGRDKRISLNFSLEKKKHELNFCIDLEALVLSFFEELNEILTETEFSFESKSENYGLCIILFIHRQEKEKLIKKGWEFKRDPHYWQDRGQKCKEKNDIGTAMLYFSKAYSISPNDMGIVSDYALNLIENSKNNEAKKVYSNAIDHLNKKLQNGDEKDKWWLNFFSDAILQNK
jgi:tetratricopeptide (TPR) repeat protein